MRWRGKLEAFDLHKIVRVADDLVLAVLTKRVCPALYQFKYLHESFICVVVVIHQRAQLRPLAKCYSAHA